MDEVENTSGHGDEDVFEAEVVEDDENVLENGQSSDAPPDGEDDEWPDAPLDSETGVDALADLAGGGKDDTGALGALAAGRGSGPVDAIAAAEARTDVGAEDALASLASGEVPSAPDDGRGPDETEGYSDDPALDFASGESIHVDPERIKASRDKRKHLAKRADDLSFKKTMVPLLLAVGVLLLGISGLTAAMTAGVDKNASPNELTALQEYGSVLVWAGLPLGLVLVGGAVMFHMEVRRVEESRRSAPPAPVHPPVPDEEPDEEPPLD